MHKKKEDNNLFTDEDHYSELIRDYIKVIDGESKRNDITIPPLSKSGCLRGRFWFFSVQNEIARHVEDGTDLEPYVHEMIDASLFRRIDNHIANDDDRTGRLFCAVCRAAGLFKGLEENATDYMWDNGAAVITDFHDIITKYTTKTKEWPFADNHLFLLTGNVMARGFDHFYQSTMHLCSPKSNGGNDCNKEKERSTHPKRASALRGLFKKRPHHLYMA